MDEKKWKHAAWMAIGAAALTPANVLLSFLADLALQRGPIGTVIVALALAVATAAGAMSLIALYRFRELLNERYAYHGIDGLVTFVIFAIVLLVASSVVGRGLFGLGIVGPPDDAVVVALAFVVPIILLGMAVGIVSIIVGIKLMSLENDLQRLIRPYALVSIIGGACFALIVLAPIGMLLLVAENIILALVFFRAGDSEPTVDFV